LAVDGLMVMASSALVATAGHRPGRSADTGPDTRTDVGAAGQPDIRPDGQTDSAPDSDGAAVPDSAPPGRMAGRRRTGNAGTAAAVARLHRRHPRMSPAEIGRRLGVTDRTVRRHLAALRDNDSHDTSPASGASSPVAA
jgi:hypothetical protein